MNTLKRNQSGFGAVEVLLLILIIAIIGFGGYYVLHSQNNAKSTTSTPSTTATTVTTPVAKKHTSAEAVSAVQTAYTKNIAAQKAAEAGPETVDKHPALTAMKPYLSDALYTKILNYKPANGDFPSDQVMCNQFGADSVKVTTKSATADSATVNVQKIVGTEPTGDIPVTVDLNTLKITAITCPA